MRLAVIIDQPFWTDGNTYSTNASFIHFVLSFAEVVDALLLFVPLCFSTLERGNFDFPINTAKVRIVPLPFFQATREVYLNPLAHVPSTIRACRNELDAWDVGWIVGGHLPSILFYLIGRRAKKPLFLYIRSNVREEMQSQVSSGKVSVAAHAIAALNHYFLFQASRNCHTFVTGDELKSLYGRSEKLTHKVYPSIILDHDIVSARNYAKHGKSILLSVGRLTPEKGIPVLIEAIEHLLHKGRKDLFCRLVGSGSEEATVQNLIQAKGLSEYVKLVGYVAPGPNLYHQYDAADLYVLPSLTEGIPKTLYEAMARGLPIIASSVGGVPEIARHGENAILVPPNAPLALADAIDALSASAPLREKLGGRGLDMVRKYTMSRQRDRMIDMISSFIVPSGA